ncbi:MAG: BrnA antitoxin family protein [bacterium]
MRKNYDFTNAVRNPYAKRLKTQITIRIENDTLDYFKKIAAETDLPYQKLINLFLRDCADQRKKPALQWAKARIHA